MVHETRFPHAHFGLKDMNGILNDKIAHLVHEQVESNSRFAGFLVFYCSLKEDTVEALKGLTDSSHMVRELPS